MKLEDEERKQASAISESAFSMQQSSEMATDPQRKSSESEHSPKTPTGLIPAIDPQKSLEDVSLDPVNVPPRVIIAPEPEKLPTKLSYMQPGSPAKVPYSEPPKAPFKPLDADSRVPVKAIFPEPVYFPSKAPAADASKGIEPEKAYFRVAVPEAAKPAIKPADIEPLPVRPLPRKESGEAVTDSIPELVISPRSDNKPSEMFIVEPPGEIPSKPPSETRVVQTLPQMFQKPRGKSLTSEEGKKPPSVFSPSTSMDMAEVEDMDIAIPAPKAVKPIKTYPSSLPRIEEESLRTSSPPTPVPLSIEVINPRTVSAGWFGSGYTLYTVQTRNQQEIKQVERRFRDLDWMHTQLSSQFKGVSIPPLPEKPMFGTQTARFIEERRAQMEKYLNMIGQNCILSKSDVVKAFLYSPSDKFEEDKARAEREAERVPFTGVEDVMDHLMAKIHSKINSTLISNFSPPSKEIIQLETRLSQLSVPTAALSTAFTAWVQGSRDMVRTIEETEIPGSEQFAQVSMRLGKLENTAIREMEKLAMDYREEVMRIEAIQNAIATYKATSEQYAQQDALIQRKEGKFRACLDDESASRYQTEVEKAKQIRDSLGKELEAIQKNLEADGSDFQGKREQHMWRTMKEVADSQVQRWQESAEFWREVRP